MAGFNLNSEVELLAARLELDRARCEIRYLEDRVEELIRHLEMSSKHAIRLNEALIAKGKKCG